MADTREVQVTDEDVLRFLKQHGAVGGLVTKFIGLAAGAAVYEQIRATPPSPSTAPEVDEVCAAAEAVVSRWDSPKWKDEPHTAVFIDRLRRALASRPAEVDDEGLPVLPEPFENWDPRCEGLVLPVFTAEQYRQGQRDAVAADRARRGVGGKIPRESNDALIALAKYWKLDGDWMTCRACRRSLIASRDGEELNHGDGCKFWDQQHPWAQLRGLIARRPAPPASAP